jgi:hypothetical protein
MDWIERVIAEAKTSAARESQLCKFCKNLESFSIPHIKDLIDSANKTHCPGCSFLSLLLLNIYGPKSIDANTIINVNPDLGGGGYLLALPLHNSNVVSNGGLIEVYRKPGGLIYPTPLCSSLTYLRDLLPQANTALGSGSRPPRLYRATLAQKRASVVPAIG